MLGQNYPMIADSPNVIWENSIKQIMCSSSSKTYDNYVENEQKMLKKLQKNTVLKCRFKCF